LQKAAYGLSSLIETQYQHHNSGREEGFIPARFELNGFCNFLFLKSQISEARDGALVFLESEFEIIHPFSMIQFSLKGIFCR